MQAVKPHNDLSPPTPHIVALTATVAVSGEKLQ